MKNNLDIRDKITQIIAEQLKIDVGSQIDWNQSLQVLGADSLDLVELVIKLEDAFKTEISDELMTQLCRHAKLDQIVACLSN